MAAEDLRMRSVLFSALVLALLGPMAGAHPKAYVNATGDELMAPRDCQDAIGVSQGGVCFAAGHLTPDVFGEATLWVADKVSPPTSGCWQQIGRDCVPFCGFVTISQARGWDPSNEVEVFIDGPTHGNPVNSRCGTFSEGFWGRVYHD